MTNIFYARSRSHQICGKFHCALDSLLGTNTLYCIAHELPELVSLSDCISPLSGPKTFLLERYGGRAKALRCKHISATGFPLTWRYCRHQVTEAYTPLRHWRENGVYPRVMPPRVLHAFTPFAYVMPVARAVCTFSIAVTSAGSGTSTYT